MDDLSDRYVEELFDGEAEAPFGMKQVWTPDVHRDVMNRIRNAPTALALLWFQLNHARLKEEWTA